MESIEAKPDRRQCERRRLRRGCKLFHENSRQYLSAETIDVSDGGVLLTVQTSRPLFPGEPVRIVVAFDDECVLSASLMSDAVIVRTAPAGDRRQQVAIQFEDPAAMEPVYEAA